MWCSRPPPPTSRRCRPRPTEGSFGDAPAGEPRARQPPGSPAVHTPSRRAAPKRRAPSHPGTTASIAPNCRLRAAQGEAVFRSAPSHAAGRRYPLRHQRIMQRSEPFSARCRVIGAPERRRAPSPRRTPLSRTTTRRPFPLPPPLPRTRARKARTRPSGLAHEASSAVSTASAKAARFSKRARRGARRGGVRVAPKPSRPARRWIQTAGRPSFAAGARS